MTTLEYQRLLPAADLDEGRMRAFEIAGRDILVCRTRGGFHAVDNVCTHAYARMHEGRLRGFRLICPLHGAAFDCRTGAVLGAPAAAALASHPLRVNAGWVEIALKS